MVLGFLPSSFCLLPFAVAFILQDVAVVPQFLEEGDKVVHAVRLLQTLGDSLRELVKLAVGLCSRFRLSPKLGKE